MTTGTAALIKMIFANLSHANHAGSCASAKKVVNVKNNAQPIMNTIGAFNGMRFRSCVAMSPASVTIATANAQGTVYANPYVNLCGFMKLSHMYTRTPIHGRRKQIGRSPTTITSRAMSRIHVLQLSFDDVMHDLF